MLPDRSILIIFCKFWVLFKDYGKMRFFKKSSFRWDIFEDFHTLCWSILGAMSILESEKWISLVLLLLWIYLHIFQTCIWIFAPKLSVWKSLKKTCPAGNTVCMQVSNFQKFAKLTIYGTFKELLSTQNVNVARYARNIT